MEGKTTLGDLNLYKRIRLCCYAYGQPEPSGKKGRNVGESSCAVSARAEAERRLRERKRRVLRSIPRGTQILKKPQCIYCPLLWECPHPGVCGRCEWVSESVRESSLGRAGLGLQRNFCRQHAGPGGNRAPGHVTRWDRGGRATAAHSKQVGTNYE